LNVKSLEELKGIKTKIEIEILMDILQHISFVYTMLIVIIGSISLYHDERCNIIIFCICCTVILNAFTHLNLPKYKKLLLNTNGKAKCRLVKCVNNLYKKIKKVTLNKIIAAVFILFVFMIPMGMAIFITTIFIYHEEYVLTVLFLGIAIIMMISMFAAMIYYASNFSETISERNVSHLSEVVTVMAIYLYLFGNKNEK
jgi:hypothetical protein